MKGLDDDGDEHGDDADFSVAGERLEDDEVLRLHVLGCKSYFLKCLSFTVQCHVENIHPAN